MHQSMRLAILALAVGGIAAAQMPPVINPRGVTNAFTQEPAPSRVTPGGVVWIKGLNFGSPGGARAPELPLPTRLGDPPVEVLINNRPAPLFSVSPGQIVAQVPWELGQGLAGVVVRRGEERTRAAMVRVVAGLPALRSVNDKGYGPAAMERTGSTVKLRATGLGLVQPPVPSGAAGQAEPASVPRVPARAYVSGLPAKLTAKLSAERVGEFDITIEVPEGARPGDVVTLTNGTQQPSSRVTFGRADGVSVQFLALPEGIRDLRRLEDGDLRGNYLVATGPRGEDGCYPGALFDFGRTTARTLDQCLIAAAPNAPGPVVAVPESSTLAAFVGPAEGEPAFGLSRNVVVFEPSKTDPLLVQLPAAASLLAGGPGGNVTAVAPGEPPTRYNIDAQSGEVSEAPAAGAPGGGGVVAVILSLDIDLGEGVRHVLSAPTLVRQNIFAVVVGDDEDRPGKAKLALLNLRGEVQQTRDFPEGWLPLVAPDPPDRPAPGPGQPPGGPGLPGGAIPQRLGFRVPVTFDQPSSSFYVVTRNANSTAHGLAVFSGDNLTGKAVAFPDGWFATACTPNIRLFNLELSRRLALLASRAPQEQFRNPCLAEGFLLLTLANQSVSAIPLPGQGQLNASASAGDVNDYLFGTNSDPANRGAADTLYVLDGVAGSAFRLDLPTEVGAFANVVPVPGMSALVAMGVNRPQTLGDAGLIWFDLEAEKARTFPVPEGFQTLTFLAVFENTRKLLARGNKEGSSGSQYLIFDLLTGDLIKADNPPGVAFVGQAPRPPAPGQPPQQQAPALQVVSTKSNYVVGGAYDDQRELVGLIAVRIP